MRKNDKDKLLKKNKENKDTINLLSVTRRNCI